MSLKIQTLMQFIEAIAPKRLAEDWDNVGLLLGTPSQEVKRILVALDIDDKVVDEAIAKKCDIIICHHPLIFKPLKAIREDLPTGKLIAELIRNNIAVYAAHTNLDAANGGVNDILAELLELKDINLLSEDKEEHLNKIVVYVPQEHLDNVRSAMAAAGAGHIGNYSHCFFAAQGEGTFLPLDNANPYIGNQGKLEKLKEWRLETVVPANNVKKVLAAMIKAHPYEEIAYDLYTLNNLGKKAGIGRIGTLQKPLTLKALAERVKSVLGVDKVKVVGNGEALISKLAVVGGAGAAYISIASFRGAQCLITGDLKYHEAQEALQRNINIIDAGHYETEAPVVTYLASKIKEAIHVTDNDVEVLVSALQSAPFVFM